MSQIPDTYIVKKYNHGWVVRDPKADSVIFLSNEELHKKGLISHDWKPVLPPPSAPKVIVVPSEQQRKRSSSDRKSDSDPNWRYRPHGLSQSAPDTFLNGK